MLLYEFLKIFNYDFFSYQEYENYNIFNPIILVNKHKLDEIPYHFILNVEFRTIIID